MGAAMLNRLRMNPYQWARTNRRARPRSVNKRRTFFKGPGAVVSSMLEWYSCGRYPERRKMLPGPGSGQSAERQAAHRLIVVSGQQPREQNCPRRGCRESQDTGGNAGFIGQKPIDA